VRKVSGWDVDRILDEYKSYAEPKIREVDIKYISAFELSSLSNLFVKETDVQLRVRHFFRAICFSLFVLLVWLISGKKLAGDQRRIEK
jgi:tyrosine-protein phosphatase SIW14